MISDEQRESYVGSITVGHRTTDTFIPLGPHYLLAMSQRQQLTDAQEQIITDLDDVAEHVAWEFDADNYEGFSTCGFASIISVDGRGSLVQRLRSVEPHTHHVRERTSPTGESDGFKVEVGRLEFMVRPDNYRGGYRISITNAGAFVDGPEVQRMDVRERLHDLLLERLKYNGYCQDARRTSRMD